MMMSNSKEIPHTEVHLKHWSDIGSAKAVVSDGCLLFNNIPVMFQAESYIFNLALLELNKFGKNFSKVLDVGAGMGVFLQELQKFNYLNYVGCDVNRNAISRLQSKWQADISSHRIILHSEPWQLCLFGLSGFDLILYDTWPPGSEAENDFRLFLDLCLNGLLSSNGAFLTIMIGDIPNPTRLNYLHQAFGKVSVYHQDVKADLPFWHHTSKRVNLVVCTELIT
jgi:SAM-dependent methyltransferase